ncbi:MAG: hypothetical protein LBK95_11785 [Bifidobacteriaceae bacterium]|nr:hypothetical protein [Bifidobacteriaceae bacterium]
MIRTILKGLGCGVASAVVTLALGVWHRASIPVGPIDFLPLGMILALLGVVGWAVTSRALAGWAGLFGAAAGAFVASQASALPGPGGDLFVQGDVIGFAWAIAAPLVTLIAAFLPHKWFRRAARRPTAEEE